MFGTVRIERYSLRELSCYGRCGHFHSLFAIMDTVINCLITWKMQRYFTFNRACIFLHLLRNLRRVGKPSSRDVFFSAFHCMIIILSQKRSDLKRLRLLVCLFRFPIHFLPKITQEGFTSSQRRHNVGSSCLYFHSFEYSSLSGL